MRCGKRKNIKSFRRSTDDPGGIAMFHRAVELKYLDGTAIEVLFQDGIVKQYDFSDFFQNILSSKRFISNPAGCIDRY